MGDVGRGVGGLVECKEDKLLFFIEKIQIVCNIDKLINQDISILLRDMEINIKGNSKRKESDCFWKVEIGNDKEWGNFWLFFLKVF